MTTEFKIGDIVSYFNIFLKKNKYCRIERIYTNPDGKITHIGGYWTTTHPESYDYNYPDKNIDWIVIRIGRVRLHKRPPHTIFEDFSGWCIQTHLSLIIKDINKLKLK